MQIEFFNHLKSLNCPEKKKVIFFFAKCGQMEMACCDVTRGTKASHLLQTHASVKLVVQSNFAVGANKVS